MMDVLMLAALMAAVFFVVRMMRRPRQENIGASDAIFRHGNNRGQQPGTGWRHPGRANACIRYASTDPGGSCYQEYR